MTAAKLLVDLKRRGIELVADGDKLRYRPQSRMTPDLVRRLSDHKPALLALIGQPEAHDRCERHDWPAAVADFVLLLTPDDLPATPFAFGGPHCVVVDRCKFLTSLRADIGRGPSGPRAIRGAMQADLRQLRDLLIPGE